ncbi:MAG: diguanylate cyclase [Sphingomonas sp.]
MKAAFDRARDALDFLEQHRLEPSVRHYEFALAWATHPGSPLAQEVRSLTEDGLRLSAEAATQLADRHLRNDRGAQAEAREQVVARQAAELGALSSDAHDVTSALERDMGTIVAQAEDWPRETGGFVARLSDAERQLAEVRAEIAKLRDRIGDAPGRLDDGDEAERDQLSDALDQSGAQRVLNQLVDYKRDYVLLMFGLDDLVGINERYGRHVGDNVLNAFTATLTEVFPRQELIRWTGNEFVVVVKDTGTTAVRVLAEEALSAMRARRLKLRGSGEWIGIVTASAGMMLGRDEGAPFVIDQARARLIDASSRGGDRVEG